MNEFFSFSAYLLASTVAHGIVLGAFVVWVSLPVSHGTGGGHGGGGGGGAVSVSFVDPGEVLCDVGKAQAADASIAEPAPVSAGLPAPLSAAGEVAVARPLDKRASFKPKKIFASRRIAASDAIPAGAPQGAGKGSGTGGGQGGGDGAGTGSGMPGEGGTGWNAAVIPPKPVRAPRPPYPGAARRSGFEGKVVLAVLVKASGLLDSIDVMDSSGREDCDAAAIDTIRGQWSFEPALLDGNPIDWKQRVVVSYKLR